MRGIAKASPRCWSAWPARFRPSAHPQRRPRCSRRRTTARGDRGRIRLGRRRHRTPARESARFPRGRRLRVRLGAGPRALHRRGDRTRARRDGARCVATSPRARSPSSSPTWRARRGCCTHSAGRATPRLSPSTGVSSARPAPADGGVEVDTQGDAFFFAFPTAPGALAAAVGLHRDARLRPDRGARRPAHRDAAPSPRRATSAATSIGRPHRRRGHGGQVLVSSSTAQLVELELPDLGEHRLKDLSAPSASSSSETATSPRSSGSIAPTCPVPATPFWVGSTSSPRCLAPLGRMRACSP